MGVHSCRITLIATVSPSPSFDTENNIVMLVANVSSIDRHNILQYKIIFHPISNDHIFLFSKSGVDTYRRYYMMYIKQYNNNSKLIMVNINVLYVVSFGYSSNIQSELQFVILCISVV